MLNVNVRRDLEGPPSFDLFSLAAIVTAPIRRSRRRADAANCGGHRPDEGATLHGIDSTVSSTGPRTFSETVSTITEGRSIVSETGRSVKPQHGQQSRKHGQRSKQHHQGSEPCIH